MWQGGADFPGGVLLLLAQLYGAMVGGVGIGAGASAVGAGLNVTLEGGSMGVAAYDAWAAQRLNNVPFYLSVLFLYGIVTVTVIEHRHRDPLDFGG